VGEIQIIIVQYGGILLSAVATAMAAYHFKGKDALKEQVLKLIGQMGCNSQEIAMLKTQTAGDRELLKQQLVSLDAELKDVKRSMRDDTNEIKGAISLISQSMTALVEKQGELSGTLSAVLHKRGNSYD